MSAHVQWIVVWNCPSFLIERNKRPPSNPQASSNSCYNRLTHSKTMGAQAAARGKGVMVVMNPRSSQLKPDTSYVRTTINKNAWPPSVNQAHDPKEQRPPYPGHGGHPQGRCHPDKPVVVKRKGTAPPEFLSPTPRSNRVH